MSLMRGPLGTQRIYISEGLAQYLPVEEEHRVEGLVLSAGRDIVAEGQPGEELFEFLLAGKFLGHAPHREDVAAEPEKVTILGGEGLVLSAEDLAQPIDGLWVCHSFLGTV